MAQVRGLNSLRLAAAISALCSSALYAAPQIINADAVENGAPFAGFIVKFDDGSVNALDEKAARRSLESAAQKIQSAAATGRDLGLAYSRRTALGADVVRSSRAMSPREAQATLNFLAGLPNVEYVEPDLVLKTTLTPNDTRYAEQWGYTDADAGIRANTAWDLATGTGVIVAVLDTGQAVHSELTTNTVAGWDFITDATIAGDGGGRDSDASDPGDYTGGGSSSWHGTHVAGTIAARTNNAAGVAGTAYNAKIMPVRVLGRGGGYTSDISDAIIWASGGAVSGVTTLSAANAADVINMSLGGAGACGTTLQNAINGAVGRGVTVVVAAGNDNADAAGFNPASCNNTITVASVTNASARSSFSNYGSKVDVAAPGSSILSTLNAGTTAPGAESFASYSGTSMASPHVAGTVALVQSRRIALGLTPFTPAEMETTLKATAYPLALACTQGCGAGIINARTAVESAQPATPTATVLTNGVALTGRSGALNSQTQYTLVVPSGATNLKFEMSGGTGNADLYVKQGAAPTTSSYTCRPYLTTNTETCTISPITAGTYYVMIHGRAAYSSVSIKGSYTAAATATALTNGVALTGRSGALNSQTQYTLVVPTGATNLKFEMSGGTGNADLYVKQGSAPTTSSYTCRPYLTTNTETCTISTITAGTYYVMIHGRAAYSSVSIKGSYTAPAGASTTMTNGVAITNISASGGVEKRYTLVVPSGRPSVSFVISGGTGDADLYTRFGSAPTTTTYTCRPYSSGNNETCTFTNPAAGTYYIMVRAKATYSGVSLRGTY